MIVNEAQSVVQSAGVYAIAVYDGEYDVKNTVIAQRGDFRAPQGLATWGMSGCHGVAVFGGQSNQAQVDWLAMFHSSGGLTTDRLSEFLKHLEKTLPQPGSEFEWVLVISQGDEREQYYGWTTSGEEAPDKTLFNVKPTVVRIMYGPAPGGSQNAFAIDFDGFWGQLGGNIVSPPIWAKAPSQDGWVQINPKGVQLANPKGKKGCCPCYISSACCQHLGLPDDCDVLETLRKYRDDVLLLTHEGRSDIEAYYRQAPAIVKRIEDNTNREQVYSVIYRDYLVPAVQLIQAGENEKAYRVYKTLVADLNRYLDLSEYPETSPNERMQLTGLASPRSEVRCHHSRPGN